MEFSGHPAASPEEKLVPSAWHRFHPRCRPQREGGNYCINRSVSLSTTVAAPRPTDFELGRLSHHPQRNHRVIATPPFTCTLVVTIPKENLEEPTTATQFLDSEFLYAKLLPFLALRHDGPRIPSLFFLIPRFMQLYPTVTVTPRVRKMKHAEPLVSPMSSELFERTPSLGGNSQSSLSDETASPSMEPRRCRIFGDSSDCNRRNGVDLCFPQLHKLPARKSTTEHSVAK